MQTLASRSPNSLAVCTFLDRTSRRIVQTPVDYRCFEIPDRFVVGFGLDYNQLYRNLGLRRGVESMMGVLACPCAEGAAGSPPKHAQSAHS